MLLSVNVILIDKILLKKMVQPYYLNRFELFLWLIFVVKDQDEPDRKINKIYCFYLPVTC
jgi:hypothetical protein